MRDEAIRRAGRCRRRLPKPPSPGIAAKRVDDETVVVSYRLGTVDPRCRPAFFQLTLDVNDDGESGANTYARIGQAQGEISVAVSDLLRGADVVIASVRTNEGRPSESSKVLIGR
jgi:hypothetical protein